MTTAVRRKVDAYHDSMRLLAATRAIENGAFVFAAAQGGTHESKRLTYGHSLIVDPWGRVLADGGEGEGVILADVDPEEVVRARQRIPALTHDRNFSVQTAGETRGTRVQVVA